MRDFMDWLGVSLWIAIFTSLYITAMFFALIGAAYFAFWGTLAPIPWFLWRFFLFFGWVISPFIALSQRVDNE
jgi:hypothetical protein